MKRTSIAKLLCASLLMTLTSCEDSVTSKPAATELVGLWKCKKLPDGFLKSAGGPVLVECSIQFNLDGTFVAKSLPERDPYRLADSIGKWDILDPSKTPSGEWSVEIDGTFLRFARRGGKLLLKQSIDVLAGYRAEYERERAE